MKKRILIIDDDVAVRGALKKVVQDTGYVVAVAADGQEGADRLAAEGFDLVVLDLNLPILSGWDLLDLTTTSFPALPIIILTGELHQCEPGACAGADAVLEKPPDVAFLLKTIERLLTESAEERLRRVSAGLTGARTTPPVGGGYLCLPKFPDWSSGRIRPGNST